MSVLFDRSLKAMHRSFLVKDVQTSQVYYSELGVQKLIERLMSVRQIDFRSACFIGPFSHIFIKALNDHNPHKIQAVTVIDSNKESLHYSMSQVSGKIKVVPLCLDEEKWAFPENYFNLIVSNLSLHWVNEVNAMFSRWLFSLQPNGMLLGTCMDGDSLQELRISLSLAEQEREGGISTHVSPMLHITDIGQALVKNDYRLMTTNADVNTLYFDNIFALSRFLKLAGETNAVNSRRKSVSRNTWIAASSIYDFLFKEKSGQFEGLIPATFDNVHFVGWKDHPSQQQPLKRGTRGIDLKTLAEEVGDDEMEEGEIREIEDRVIAKMKAKKKDKTD